MIGVDGGVAERLPRGSIAVRDGLHFLLICVPIIALVMLLAYLVAVADRGFDLTDEGYYLLLSQHSDDVPAMVSAFGYYTGILYRLAGGDVATFRILGGISLLLTGVLFAIGAIRTINRQLDVSDNWAEFVSKISFISGGVFVYYARGLPTPSSRRACVRCRVPSGLRCGGSLLPAPVGWDHSRRPGIDEALRGRTRRQRSELLHVEAPIFRDQLDLASRPGAGQLETRDELAGDEGDPIRPVLGAGLREHNAPGVVGQRDLDQQPAVAVAALRCEDLRDGRLEGLRVDLGRTVPAAAFWPVGRLLLADASGRALQGASDQQGLDHCRGATTDEAHLTVTAG